MKGLLLLSLFCVSIQFATAWSPVSPYQHVVSRGSFFFVMLPTQYEKKDGKFVESDGPSGTSYRVTWKGKIKKMWSIKSFYAFPGDIHLSSDGKSVALFRNQFMGQDGTFFNDPGSNSVLRIYRKGKLVADFEAKDLMTDLKKGIVPTLFGIQYGWQNQDLHRTQLGPSRKHFVTTETEGRPGMIEHPDVLQFATFERILFLIDSKTGVVVSRNPIPKEQKEEETTDSSIDPFAE